MAKKLTSSKIKGGQAVKAWRMIRYGHSYREIGDELNRTSTAIKLYAQRKYKEEANKLWADEIKTVGVCEIPGCTRTDLNAHHLLGKGDYPQFRFDLSNGVCLCSEHHTLNKDICPHGSLPAAEAFIKWLKRDRKGQYQWYEEHKFNKEYVDIDYEAVFNDLRQM